MSAKSLLLSAQQIDLKIQRLGNEVAEHYYNTKQLFVFGIEKQGLILAERICQEIKKNISIQLELHKLFINKKDPIGSVKIQEDVLKKLKNKDVLIVDDVLNSGKTMFYALQAFVDIDLNSLRVLVLVNRSHQQFPVHPDFVGMTLSTTFQNHIEAVLNTKPTSQVFLLSR